MRRYALADVILKVANELLEKLRFNGVYVGVKTPRAGELEYYLQPIKIYATDLDKCRDSSEKLKNMIEHELRWAVEYHMLPKAKHDKLDPGILMLTGIWPLETQGIRGHLLTLVMGAR